MELLAAGAWTLDVAFFAILIIGLLVGTAFGFLKCVTNLAGTILSIVLAASFCVAFKNNLESWFGLQTALFHAIGSDFAASSISTVISFVALVVLIRLIAWVLGNAGTALIGKSQFMASFNRILGGLTGLVIAAAFIFLLLALFFWINAEGVNAFIEESKIVSAIYKWDYFRYTAQFLHL